MRINTSRVEDGMRYPSIDKLVEVTHSKYKLIVATAKRAKQLNRKEDPEKPLIENPKSKKAIGIALEEIVSGKVRVVDLDE